MLLITLMNVSGMFSLERAEVRAAWSILSKAFPDLAECGTVMLLTIDHGL